MSTLSSASPTAEALPDPAADAHALTMTAKPIASDLLFWGALMALNLLLFLPLFLFHRAETSLIPPVSSTGGPAMIFNQLAVGRSSYDPFRISLELLVLVGIWTFVRRLRTRSVSVIIHTVYLFAVLYYLYEALSLSIYQVRPIFYNQYPLFVDGIGFLLQGLQVAGWQMAVVAIVLLATTTLIALLLRVVLNIPAANRLSRRSRILLAILPLLTLVALARYQTALANPQMVVSSLGFKVSRNFFDSLESYRNTRRFDDAQIQQTYNLTGYDLAEKPNIYLIFVESYGSVLYKRTDYDVAYRSLGKRLHQRLTDGGWHVSSTLSEAPLWGGGSWMSYASALFGLHIDAHPHFLTLLKKYQHRRYPDLGHYLKQQGYRYYRASALATELTDQAWKQYLNFYNVDEWLQYGDLDYSGKRYGWGPAPPDQYVLNFARDKMVRESGGPFLFFYITQNSHYPWQPHPELVDEWKMLNQAAEDDAEHNDEAIEHTERRQNYWNAIDYQLNLMTEFVLSEENENTIFVFVGDHQPPRVSRRSDGWDTPIHIVSKHADFNAGLTDYGFVPGLILADAEPTMRHEGFYTLFVRSLLSTFGADPNTLPDYLPDGIQFTNRRANRGFQE